MALGLFEKEKLEEQQKCRRVSQQGASVSTKLTPWQEFVSLIKTLALFLAIALFLRASVVEAFKIPSESMKETLQVGDHILVNKLAYGFRLPFIKETVLQFSTAKREDIVVFTQPDNPLTPEIDESDTNIIKRVIGVPGDVVEVRGEHVYINGELFSDKHAQWIAGGAKDFGPVKVPAGKVLLLGDNRDQSRDSRYWLDPFLSTSRIKGKAMIIYWAWPSLSRIFTILR